MGSHILIITIGSFVTMTLVTSSALLVAIVMTVVAGLGLLVVAARLK